MAANGTLRCLEIWARLADVLTDSKGIRKLAGELKNEGWRVTIRDSKDLHAKVFCSDDRTAILGSANLTDKAINNGLEIVACCSAPGEMSQIRAVLESIKGATQVVTLEDLDYFNANQRPELEEAKQDTDKPNFVPIWRRNAKIPAPPESEGRRAFLVGSGARSEKVHLIVKMALWGQRSINRYELLGKTRLKKIYPANDMDIADLKNRGYEVDEPYYAEGETDLWVEYGIEQAAKLGLKLEV